MKHMSRICFAVIALLTLSQITFAGDWTRFRGPNGTGISSDEVAPPTEWSPDENLKWKTPLPGEGVSCPIVVGDRVFVTCYSGYGTNNDAGEMEDLKRHLVCVDRNSGEIAWTKTVKAVLPEDRYSGAGVPEHGYASHTPVSDGNRVYAFFGKSGAYAYDLNGKELWHRSLGTESDQRRWGSSSSPILVKDTLVVSAGPESRSIVGLNAETGEERWKAEAEGFGSTWGTPALSKVDKDRTDLVIGAPYEIWGLNPETGKLRWYCEAMDTNSFNSSVVIDDGMIYAIEGRSGGSIALKSGGTGDVTKSHTVWSGRDSNRFGTPVLHDGSLYFIYRGIANSIDAKTGERIYQERLPRAPSIAQTDAAPPSRSSGRFGSRGSNDYSSPIMAGGLIYYTTRSGDMHVIRPGSEFDSVSINRVTNETENFSSTPAVSNGELFFRSDRHLYCVSAKKAERR